MLIAALAACSDHKPSAQNGSVPVTVALAMQGPVAATLQGLGHVQGFNTASARAQTSGLITSIDFQEGQTVRAGQPLAQIDPRPLRAQLAQDGAALQRDLAALANARDSLARAAPLVSQGLASAQQVEGYRAQVAQLVAAAAGDRAMIQRDRLALGYATIRAPIAGVTGVRLVDTGNLVGLTDPAGVVTVVQIQPIAIVFTLPQSTIGAIRSAMAAATGTGPLVEAIGQEGGGVLDRGRLLAIDNRVDDASGTVTLKAIFPNAGKQLWPGQQVTARVVLGTDARAVSIPASALQRNAGGSYVWVVDKANRAAPRPVLTGPRTGDSIVVRQGVAAGERVVTDGQFALSTGAVVTITTPAAAAVARRDNPDQLGLNP
ncbi:hypothetical protein A7X12_06880 [Sphingomonas sp. TDK1]|nr:hypothetical protein A7X12_06880 [Sphingomonas sp. TDK1]